MKNAHLGFCFLALIYFLSVSIGCKTETEQANIAEMDGRKVFSANNSDELSAYGELKLDSIYPNLLDPTVSGDSITSVMNSWMLLHQAISTQLDRNSFSWQSQDSIIEILHKIYFNEDGQIDYYLFRVFNESVNDSIVSAFSVEIDSFTNNFIMQLDMDRNYAQCGKTSYMNHNLLK